MSDIDVRSADRDRVVQYLATATDQEIAELLAESGDERTSGTGGGDNNHIVGIIRDIEELQAALVSLEERVKNALERGDVVGSIALKQQSQPLRNAWATKQQELNTRLQTGRS